MKLTQKFMDEVIGPKIPSIVHVVECAQNSSVAIEFKAAAIEASLLDRIEAYENAKAEYN